MKLKELKEVLIKSEVLRFFLPEGKEIPPHFHLTEVAKNSKQYIDCGGTLRLEESISLQLWHDSDYAHRLSPQKFLDILGLAEDKLLLGNAEIEVEYQAATIGKYGLEFKDGNFWLVNKKTDCLAKEGCGIPSPKPKIKLSQLVLQSNCSPENGCC